MIKNSDGLESSEGRVNKTQSATGNSVSKIRIKLKSYDTKVLDEAAKKIADTLRKLGIIFSGPTPMPIQRTFISVLKSPHVHKDARQLFEIREKTRILQINESKAAVAALNEIKYSHPAIMVSIKIGSNRRGA